MESDHSNNNNDKDTQRQNKDNDNKAFNSGVRTGHGKPEKSWNF